MNNDPLLQPFHLRHLALRNRVILTSHEPAYTDDGMPKERYRRYHLERARAGVAMVMTAGSASVSRDSPPAFGNILAWKDEVVGWMKQLTDDCHAEGAAVMIQLTHLGYRTRWDKGDWLPVLGAGPVREPAHRAFPKIIEDWDMDRIITDYADATQRMQEAGLDGVEYEFYGHLLDQVFSPLTNQLAEPWGGSFDNRLRFAANVLTACRKRVGPDFILGIRFVADEAQQGGITMEDGIRLAKQFKAAGLIDFINIIRGRIHTDAALADVIPLQGMKSAPHLDFAGRMRAEVGLPTLHAARIPDVATARHAIASGLLDLVGMTRAHMADPHIMRKIRDGHEDDIRPCVGATYCLDRIYQGGMALCIHNPATGREETMPHDIEPGPKAQNIVIVGAGPAGLEAARVAALRGHHVTVFEAADQPGGQVRLLAQSKRRAEMIGIIDWRMAQCSKAGVTFRFNHWAEATDILTQNPDIVIIATGGYPQTDILEQGHDLACSAWDILSGDQKIAGNVLFYDDAGDHTALQAIQKIAETGARVEVITPERTFAPEVMGLNLVPYMRAIQDKDVTITLAKRVRALTRHGNMIEAMLGSDYMPLQESRHAEQVVINHGTAPLDALYFELKPLSHNKGAVDYESLVDGRPQPYTPAAGEFLLYRIGDAVESRNIHAAIYDGLRLMKNV